MKTAIYEPKGIRFFDRRNDREMLLVGDDEPQAGWRGWLFYRHPDGQWVSLRKATDEDRKAIDSFGVVRVEIAAPIDPAHELRAAELGHEMVKLDAPFQPGQPVYHKPTKRTLKVKLCERRADMNRIRWALDVENGTPVWADDCVPSGWEKVAGASPDHIADAGEMIDVPQWCVEAAAEWLSKLSRIPGKDEMIQALARHIAQHAAPHFKELVFQRDEYIEVLIKQVHDSAFELAAAKALLAQADNSLFLVSGWELRRRGDGWQLTKPDGTNAGMKYADLIAAYLAAKELAGKDGA